MAANQVYDQGRKLTLPVPAGTKSGQPVVIGKLSGVALIDADSANKATVDLGGVYKLKVSAVDGAGNNAVAIGDELFFTAGDEVKLSKKDTGVSYGHALDVVAAGATAEIKVRLKG